MTDHYKNAVQFYKDQEDLYAGKYDAPKMMSDPSQMLDPSQKSCLEKTWHAGPCPFGRGKCSLTCGCEEHYGANPVESPVSIMEEPPRTSTRFGNYTVRFADPSAVLYFPAIIIRPENLTVGEGSRVDSMVKLEAGEGMTIGRYAHIASHAHIGIGGGVVVLGDYSAVASHGMVISGSNQIDAISMSACAPAEMQRATKSQTVIKKFACVLAGGIVLPGVTLHEGAVLAAGGVATKDIPAWELWGGTPAKFMRKRQVLAQYQHLVNR